MGKTENFRDGCYKKVCESCINCMGKRLFGGFDCRIGKKASQNKCYYFTCPGKGLEKCEKCTDHKDRKRINVAW